MSSERINIVKPCIEEIFLPETSPGVHVPLTPRIARYLKMLDGSAASAIRLITDVQDLSLYGGMPGESVVESSHEDES